MFRITDAEIDYAEKVLLPQGEIFNEERRTVIKCLESKDIKACPGSGKTSTLLAKLVIMAEQLPLNNNKGVCVLTHTNVAINEITERLGEKSAKLFNYPNHFGTIQSFVDKYLAVPAYTHYYKKRPSRIDNEIYSEQVERRFGLLSFPARAWLTRQREYMDKLKNMRFSTEDFDCLVEGLYGREVIRNRTGPAFRGLLQFKLDLLKSGVLCFDDAYSLAYRYLRDFPQLKEVFSERFAIVLVDEMQDTDKHQNELFNQIFSERVVVQRVGDNNQAIFNNTVKDCQWNIEENCLTITNSKRFSNSIAKVVNKICLEPHEQLSGDDGKVEINPKLIIFNDVSIHEVLPKFGDIIIDNGLQEEGRQVFKAVGWIAKHNERGHTLPSYWPNYSVVQQHRKIDFDALSSYLKPRDNDLIGAEGAEYYRKAILRVILKCLRVLEVRNQGGTFYQEQSLMNFLKEAHPELYDILRFKLAQWCLNIHNGANVVEEVKEFIRTELCPTLDISNVEKLDLFLDEAIEEPETEDQPVVALNVYKHIRNEVEINVHINTVHSVKGETHTATLYLETFYNGYDVIRIIEYLKGNHTKATAARIISTLKVAHVGISRPTHLLCVAIHENNIDHHVQELTDFGWDIIDLRNLRN